MHAVRTPSPLLQVLNALLANRSITLLRTNAGLVRRRATWHACELGAFGFEHMQLGSKGLAFHTRPMHASDGSSKLSHQHRLRAVSQPNSNSHTSNKHTQLRYRAAGAATQKTKGLNPEEVMVFQNIQKAANSGACAARNEQRACWWCVPSWAGCSAAHLPPAHAWTQPGMHWHTSPPACKYTGVWTKDLKIRTNLAQPQITKILKVGVVCLGCSQQPAAARQQIPARLRTAGSDRRLPL